MTTTTTMTRFSVGAVAAQGHNVSIGDCYTKLDEAKAYASRAFATGTYASVAVHQWGGPDGLDYEDEVAYYCK